MSKAAELAALIGSQSALSNRNLVINGAMQVAQRGTSLTDFGGSDAYATVDRWHFDVAATSAGRATIEQVSDAPNGFANSLKLSCTTADTSIAAGERLQIQQRFEGQNLQLVGKGTSGAKPLTVSFYVKANGTFTYGLELFDGDNSRQITKLFTTTTDWQRVELNFPADTTGTLDNDNALSFYVIFAVHAGSTYTSGTLNSDAWAASVNGNRAAGIDSFFSSTSNTLFITGVQLEVGEQATPFEHRSFGDELRRCQRYAYKIGGSRSDTFGAGQGLYQDGNEFNFGPYFPPVTLRANPSLTAYGTAPNIKINGGANTGFTPTISCPANEMQFIRLTKASHGLSSSHVANMNFASTSDYIILDAEL